MSGWQQSIRVKNTFPLNIVELRAVTVWPPDLWCCNVTHFILTLQVSDYNCENYNCFHIFSPPANCSSCGYFCKNDKFVCNIPVLPSRVMHCHALIIPSSETWAAQLIIMMSCRTTDDAMMQDDSSSWCHARYMIIFMLYHAWRKHCRFTQFAQTWRYGEVMTLIHIPYLSRSGLAMTRVTSSNKFYIFPTNWDNIHQDLSLKYLGTRVKKSYNGFGPGLACRLVTLSLWQREKALNLEELNTNISE